MKLRKYLRLGMTASALPHPYLIDGVVGRNQNW